MRVIQVRLHDQRKRKVMIIQQSESSRAPNCNLERPCHNGAIAKNAASAPYWDPVAQGLLQSPSDGDPIQGKNSQSTNWVGNCEGRSNRLTSGYTTTPNSPRLLVHSAALHFCTRRRSEFAACEPGRYV